MALFKRGLQKPKWGQLTFLVTVMRMDRLEMASLRLHLEVQSRNCLGAIEEKEKTLLAKRTTMSISVSLLSWKGGCI